MPIETTVSYMFRKGERGVREGSPATGRELPAENGTMDRSNQPAV